jgi:aminomethyltransferase
MRRATWQLGVAARRHSNAGLREQQQQKRTSSDLFHQVLTRRSFAADQSNSSTTSSLKKTALYDLHVEQGGKMVPFAGWSMPIQYKDSIMESTINCRAAGSLFDVSHMCGLSLKGPDAIPFLETLVVGDIVGLAPGTGTLSVFTNENGGVIDDTVVTKVGLRFRVTQHIHVCVCVCRERERERERERLPVSLSVHFLSHT